MILGIGTDLCNIERIERTLERFGDRFRDRVFTETEQRKARSRADTPGTYAKRWAAKEACSKALGTGLRMGVRWRELEVRRERGQAPTLVLHGRCRDLSDARGGRRMLLSLTHDGDYALAQAMLIGDAAPPDAPSAR